MDHMSFIRFQSGINVNVFLSACVKYQTEIQIAKKVLFVLEDLTEQLRKLMSLMGRTPKHRNNKV